MPAFEFYVSKLILYMFFCAWFLSLEIMQLNVAEIHLFSWLYDIPLYAIPQFIFSVIDGDIGSIYISEIMLLRTFLYMFPGASVQKSTHTHTHTLRGGIAGSQVMHTFNVTR